MFPVFKELDITLVAYTPLAKGFLSGAYDKRPEFGHPEDNRSGRHQYSEEGFKYYQAVLDLIRDIAKEKNATLAQISLAWMMNKEDFIVPIPGTRTPSRMKENLDASDIKMTKDELSRIDEALEKMNLSDTASFWKPH